MASQQTPLALLLLLPGPTFPSPSPTFCASLHMAANTATLVVLHPNTPLVNRWQQLLW